MFNTRVEIFYFNLQHTKEDKVFALFIYSGALPSAKSLYKSDVVVHDGIVIKNRFRKDEFIDLFGVDPDGYFANSYLEIIFDIKLTNKF